MATASIPDTMTKLAVQAADLSSELYGACEIVNQTGTEVDSMAGELAVLSTVVWRLHGDITTDIHRYTEAFMQDLEEIMQELKVVFSEVAEVRQQFPKIDNASRGTIKSFFRKSKLSHLRRHLDALKSTLMVMRTVLEHGKEYGKQSKGTSTSPSRLLRVDPHVMFEDKTILDTVIKTNRDAIVNLDKPAKDQNRAATSGEHQGRSSGGPALPPISDTVSPSPESSDDETVRENFSRKDSRLGAHTSIMDMGAHTSPDTLKDKWIRASRAQRTRSLSKSGTVQPSPPTSPTQETRTRLKESPRANISPRKRKGSKSDPRRSVDTEASGLASKPTPEKLQKVINSLENAHVTGLSKMVPHFHNRKRSLAAETDDDLCPVAEDEVNALPGVPESPTAKTRFPIH